MYECVEYPMALRQTIEASLIALLHSFVDEGGIPRCLVAFIRNDQLDPPYKTDESWRTFNASTTIGLAGHAIRNDDIFFYDENDNAEGPFEKGDDRTVYEVAASIRFHDAVTAVFLIDYFDTETLPRPSRLKVERWRNQVAKLLEGAARRAEEIEAELNHLAETVVTASKGLRGYVALKQWDGKMRYFTAGTEKEKFRYFSQLEGICGDVLRRGKPLNVGYVWDHPSYRSSDNRIQSEAVNPILVNGECVGVLNVESEHRDHFKPEYIAAMDDANDDLVRLARDFRHRTDEELGAHSRLLSDLVEQLGVPSDVFGTTPNDEEIWDWAVELCRVKISSLKDVVSATTVDVPARAQHEDRRTVDFRPAHEGHHDYEVIEASGGDWKCYFDLLSESIPRSRFEVHFGSSPSQTSLEVIEQFCRLASNETARRSVELRGAEFERFVHDILDVTSGTEAHLENLIAALPFTLRRMMNCDHVTYLKVTERTAENVPVLRVWQTTSPRLTFKDDRKHFYLANVNEGLTGYAATQRDVFIVKSDTSRLKEINRNLKTLGRICESENSRFRAFFAIPVHGPEGLVAVVRGHRSVKHNNVSFSDADRERLVRIQFLIESAIRSKAPRDTSAAPQARLAPA